jgi:hypothetical protein
MRSIKNDDHSTSLSSTDIACRRERVPGFIQGSEMFRTEGRPGEGRQPVKEICCGRLAVGRTHKSRRPSAGRQVEVVKPFQKALRKRTRPNFDKKPGARFMLRSYWAASDKSLPS